MFNKCLTFLIQVSILVVDGFLVDPRKVVKEISVTNGAGWGDWHPPHYCAEGAYAVGFNMKVEENQHERDDTSLNGLELLCETPTGKYAGYVASGEGQWGNWLGDTKCESNSESHKFLIAFQLEVESYQGDGDDTAANWIRFKCGDYDNNPSVVLDHYPGYGHWGTYGGWSESCPLHSAICGIQSRIEGPQGIVGDDTAFNDVKFFCCGMEDEYQK